MTVVLYNETLKGILQHIKSQNPQTYQNQFTIAQDSFHGSLYGKYAFDLNASTFWTSSDTCDPNPWVSICFKHYRVKLTGFEIQTSYGTCRPKTISFGEFTNNLTFNSQTYEVNMTQGSIIYRNFSGSSFSRCFKYIGNENSQDCSPSGYRTDITQIELYGFLVSISELRNLIKCTKSPPFFTIKVIFISVLSMFIS